MEVSMKNFKSRVLLMACIASLGTQVAQASFLGRAIKSAHQIAHKYPTASKLTLGGLTLGGTAYGIHAVRQSQIIQPPITIMPYNHERDEKAVVGMIQQFSRELDSYPIIRPQLLGRQNIATGAYQKGGVARTDKETIGFVVYGGQPGQLFTISNMAVDTPHQSKGCGKKLLSHAVDEAEKKQAYFVMIHVNFNNQKAQEFYEKNGFSRHESLDLHLLQYLLIDGGPLKCYIRYLKPYKDNKEAADAILKDMEAKLG